MSSNLHKLSGDASEFWLKMGPNGDLVPVSKNYPCLSCDRDLAATKLLSFEGCTFEKPYGILMCCDCHELAEDVRTKLAEAAREAGGATR